MKYGSFKDCSSFDWQRDNAFDQYDRALLLDSKAYVEYRKGNLREAIAHLQLSLEIKLNLKKFGSVREMQLALSHLKRWRSRDIIASKTSQAKPNPVRHPAQKKIYKALSLTVSQVSAIRSAEM